MAGDHAREKLLDLIDTKVFNPVLKASPERYSNENEKAKLQDVQRATRNTQRSYHEKYTTAQAVRENFRADLDSHAANKVHRTSKELGLPTLNDIKDDFEKLARELGVGSK